MYSVHAVTAAARGARFAVPTTTLDALCDQYGLRPDLVKIDVEGAESKVLAGSVLLAGSRQTRYLVELHSNPELSMLENGKRVLDWCGSVGFEAWYLKEHCALRSPQLIADRGRCHVLLQPSGWPYPDWLRGISQSAAVPDVFASH
jgi:hypothetical protein